MEQFRETLVAEHASSCEGGNASVEAIDYTSACQQDDNFRQAAHAFIFARLGDDILWDNNKRAAILMQMRFDGSIGFPGGLIDEGETPVEALNRELKEEINLDLNVVSIKKEDHLTSHKIITTDCKKGFITHFFKKEVDLQTFKNVERDALTSGDWGGECLGLIRVPLYCLKKDGQKTSKGFPTFLCNRFAGTAKLQLIEAIYSTGILAQEELSDRFQRYLEIR